ncbi:unnamed protein product [Moneuplotes crassus]|uniref:THAP4-like heme-binding domain-containing protein n=2 Tax=Euplotes crassus TaxID=5936 RepID=A0AAD2D6B6_EUPCR|nr:unnamed protein product [Moneuplotes crassus]
MEQGSTEDFPYEGNWEGTGVVINSKGEEKVRYKETLEIKLIKTAPVNIYMITSSTYKEADPSFSMHFETGFIKLLPATEEGNKVEMSLTHPFSINEFSFGSYNKDTKALTVEAGKEHLMRGNTAQGKSTTGFKREYTITEDGSLHYKMYLGVDDNDLYHHLTGELTKSVS